MSSYIIRSMTLSDVPRLVEVQARFSSNSVLRVEKTGTGLFVEWRLTEVPLPKPFDKGDSYDFDDHERENIMRRLHKKNTLLEVAVDLATNRIVGVLDVAEEEWNNTAFIWNIMIDERARGQGIGRRFIDHTIEWARQKKLRAIMLETQTNNVPACRFYSHMGFHLTGIHDSFYGNNDYQKNEIAIFWTYPLSYD